MEELCKHCNYFLKVWNSCPLYNNDTLFNYFMSFISALIYIIILIQFINWVFGYRDNRKFNIFLNIIFNYFYSNLIKKLVKQERPDNYCAHGYGMPSNHSSVIFSILTFLILEYFIWDKNCFFKKNPYYKFEIPFMIILVILNGYSRYYLSYHFINQIIIGSLAGFFLTIIFFFILYKIWYSKDEEKRYDSFLYKLYYLLRLKNNLNTENFIKGEIRDQVHLYNKIYKEKKYINKLTMEMKEILNNVKNFK